MLLKITPEMRVYGPYLRTYKRTGQQRRQVAIRLTDGRKTSMSYSRWLMQEHLGRVLLPSEHVDHVDEDPLHDDIANLQLLSPSENARKSARAEETITFVCPVCSEPATRSARKVRHNRKQGKAGPFCGRSCARRWQLSRA